MPPSPPRVRDRRALDGAHRGAERRLERAGQAVRPARRRRPATRRRHVHRRQPRRPAQPARRHRRAVRRAPAPRHIAHGRAAARRRRGRARRARPARRPVRRVRRRGRSRRRPRRYAPHTRDGGARAGPVARRLPRRRRHRAGAPRALRDRRAARPRRPAGGRGAADRVAVRRQAALAGSARPRHDRRPRRMGPVLAGGLSARLRPRARLRHRRDAPAPALSRMPDGRGRRGRAGAPEALVSRARQASLLVRPTLRTLPWERFGGCAAVAVARVWALAGADSARTILVVQCAAAALCVGAAAAAEDPAGDTTAAVPPPLRFRLTLRLAIGTAALAAAWATVLWLGGIRAPWTGVLTLQLLALAALTWALAATLPHGAAVAGPVVALVFLVARIGLPGWTYASSPGSGRTNLLWIAVLIGGVVALGLATRDPARRSTAAGRRDG